MNNSARVRNLAIVGQLHHGKTSLIDVLVTASHPTLRIPEGKMPRYMDNLFTEQRRLMTLKTKPMTLLLPTLQGTSMVINMMDTPGHADFMDEVSAALRMADGIVLVVDAVEGVLCQTEELVKSALAGGLPIILVINKVERLFLELKLPPTDAYYKLRHLIEEVNTIISNNGEQDQCVSPERGNVLFASTQFGWMFSLRSFASVFVRRAISGQESGMKVDLEEFSKRLWGDIYYDAGRGSFRKSPVEGATKRTFIAFILEPLYKLYGCVMSQEKEELKETLTAVGIKLKDAEYRLNVKSLLRLVLGFFFGNSSAAFVDVVTAAVKDPQESAFGQVMRTFTGPLDSDMCKVAQKCSADAPLVAFASKVYPKGDAALFDVLVRVYSGTLRRGQAIRVLGENYSAENNDDTAECHVTELLLGCGRYRIPVAAVPAGCWALVGGMDEAIFKTGTIISVDNPFSGHVGIFKPLTANNRALFKVAIEPVTPSELPKMLDGLRKISKTYPFLSTKVEDSGEHTVLGTGELYMDCALYDLRRLYADMQVKVADPVAKFAETVAESGYLKCFAETPNHRNKLTIICEPLEKGLAEALEAGRLPSPRQSPEHAKELARILQKDFGWDILAARSVWGFGPDERTGPNLLIDDTLPSEVDKEGLQLIRDFVIQGFQWACREGPLCEEPVRGVKFRLIDATIATDAIHRGAGQIIPTVRRVCYSAMLTATPRLMEPVLFVEIQTQNDFVEAVYNVLAKRRGHVTFDSPRAGSPLYVIRALLPLLDSFGFETDLRIHSHGMAYCQMRQDHWQIVPGDPLDRSIKLLPLEPSPAPHLARDCLLKTRRRKGLGEDVAVAKFFDQAMLTELAREEAISGIQGLYV
jgi:U5 small nuclear ribonucleoprotein component